MTAIARARTLTGVSRALSSHVEKLRFGAPIAFVYNPLAYARAPHETYLERFGRGRKEALFVGMNPGPFGMAQTGVPFGDVSLVREWMGIEGRVDKPEREHEKRPVLGFGCARSEVSGSRLWGWARDRFGVADRFFERFFVTNYCPLVFMEQSSRNFTPDKLEAKERDPLFDACDSALRRVVELVRPTFVVGVGAFAKKRARVALEGVEVKVGAMLHPSPASPKANRGWALEAEKDLARLGIELPSTGGARG